MPASSIYVRLASIKNISVSFCLPACLLVWYSFSFHNTINCLALQFTTARAGICLWQGRGWETILLSYYFSSALSLCRAAKVFDVPVVVEGWGTRPGVLLICSASITLTFSLGFKLNWWHCWGSIVLYIWTVFRVLVCLFFLYYINLLFFPFCFFSFLYQQDPVKQTLCCNNSACFGYKYPEAKWRFFSYNYQSKCLLRHRVKGTFYT